jgi:hypothetical protein
MQTPTSVGHRRGWGPEIGAGLSGGRTGSDFTAYMSSRNPLNRKRLFSKPKTFHAVNRWIVLPNQVMLTLLVPKEFGERLQ